ncbi:hypothetical protein M9434_003157 [Picochlorum sp. BPE23]|nr:hypothetical protein M9434_003157 [Picochlorum sp. BPE23]
MDPFYVGFAMSVYQCSGDEKGSPSNWGHWNDTWKTMFGRTKIAGGRTCGESNDFWNLYKEDIDRAAEMGSNAFRLSLEWSRLQPKGNGQDFDSKAVSRFHEILDYLIEFKKMEPFLSLHHYVHPQWFESLGGFTKRDNIRYFVDYCTAAYKEFGSKVKFWCTFNEPGVASFAGFIHGSFPPGKLMRFHGYGMHLRNMLIAHTEAYDAIKSLPGASSSSIGIVHNWFWFEPVKPGSCCWFTPPYVTCMANLLNRMWGNDILIRYLNTGEFDYNPLWGLYGRIQYTNPGGKPGCDHFGLNYYSRGLMDWKLAASKNPGEMMTDMPYALYAEGIFKALEGISVLNIPIYITETGVADSGDSVRPVMIQTYMSAIEQAIRAGHDIRGVLYWSLVDNFEWAFGYTMKFGIYEWDASSQQRLCRQSGQLLKHWFKRLVQLSAARPVPAVMNS